MNDLQSFSVDQLRPYIRSRDFLFSDLWEMGQRLPKCKDIEQEAYDTMFGKYGHIDVATFTSFEVARLCGYDV